MRYLATLIGDDTSPAPGTPQWDEDMEGYARFDEVAGSAILGGEALQDAATATTVRVADGRPIVTAGPFAEVTEMVGGYFVLEADDLDAVIELVAQIPAVKEGGVEVRPMVDWFDGDGIPGTDERPRHVALILSEETAAEQPGTPEWDAGAVEHARFHEAAGAMVRGGGSLHPVATATTVRRRDGEVLVTDGPHAERTEVVGGFYLLHPATTEEAVAIAAQIPVNPGGGVELRPVMEVDV